MTALTRIQWNKFNKIKFDEKSHTYTFDNEVFTSVTQLLGKLKPKFDDTIAERYAKKNNLPLEYVKQLWEIKALVGTTKGTETHFYIESFLKYNITNNPSVAIDIEARYFHNFYNQWKHKPIKLEFITYYKEKKIAGTMDCIAKDDDGNYYIYDWKSDKQVKTNSYGTTYDPPLSHLENITMNSWSLQLSIYRYILEKELNLPIKGQYIVHFNRKNPNFMQYTIPYMKDEVEIIFNNC